MALITAAVSGFVWWVKREVARNDKAHEAVGQELNSVNKRVDHLILHLLPEKPYKEDKTPESRFIIPRK